jgi:7-keto-8-aminopelargonate synthetase-like enzyme
VRWICFWVGCGLEIFELTEGRILLDALQKNIAVTRGEALAAQLVASAALQVIFTIIGDKERMLKAIAQMLDDTLNISGPVKEDGQEAFHIQMRETARNVVDQHLGAIARQLKPPPTAQK